MTTFEETAKAAGVIHAIKVHYPGVAIEHRRTHDERQALIETRQRAIGIVARLTGLGFTAAEAIVDGKRDLPQ